MAVRKRKKPDIQISVSRTVPPASDVAAELDRVASEQGETVQSVGFKAIRLGLPEAERKLKEFTPKTKP